MVAAENKVWFLKRSRLFERATSETVANSEHLFTQTIYPNRSLIFEQGDIGRLVYLVKTGKVRIARVTEDGKEITIAILGPGDLFGEELLFCEAVRSTFATCLEDSLLCMARAGDLYGLLTRHPVLAINVAKYLQEQRDDAMSIVEDLAYLKVPERLLKLFERLALEFGVVSTGGTLIDVQLTQANIASLVGSTRETVSLEMMHLARDGRIEMRGRRILIPKSGPPSLTRIDSLKA